MLDFKSFRSAACLLVAIELMHMIRKDQFMIDGAKTMSFPTGAAVAVYGHPG